MAESLFKYGMLENVSLTPVEHAKLIEKMGPKKADRYIDQLSTYIPNRSKKPYKNHYAVILQWWLQDQRDDDSIEAAVDDKEPEPHAQQRRESFQERSVRNQKESSERVRESLSGTTRDRSGLEHPARPGDIVPSSSRRPRD